MAKLNVELLRWLILGGNLLLIGLTGFVAYEFFMGERKDLRIELYDPNQYIIDISPASSNTDAKEIAEVLYAKPRVRQVAPPPQVVDTRPVRQDGPLDELAYVYFVRLGEPMAELQVKTEQLNTPAATTNHNTRRRPNRSTRP